MVFERSMIRSSFTALPTFIDLDEYDTLLFGVVYQSLLASELVKRRRSPIVYCQGSGFTFEK